ncbi:MAG: esterase family protein [Candidatus Eremiobacteraeota bacterium]|nr:esterase family protein [Candidatus Eremiobacteraeota bacterium]
MQARDDQVLEIKMHSAALGSFWHQDVQIAAAVLLPDDYYKQPDRRFPTIYVFHAFEGTHTVTAERMANWQHAQRAAQTQFIVVFLDANVNGGYHAFADSQNYGPWGTALVSEFIPMTEGHFRTIRDARARFVTGHSSGGWASLWLQVTHPDLVGGVWSISPDPVDFHDFTGPDLVTEPLGNFYRDARGTDYIMCAHKGCNADSLRTIAQQEWGVAQFDTFDSVFSPKGTDGKPQPLFDRKSGTIDPAVAKYWESHWDIDRVLAQRWAQDGAKLRGKIHVFVGDSDTFGLDRPVHLMQTQLQKLDADAKITFVPGADHWTVFNAEGGLLVRILREMSATLAP